MADQPLDLPAPPGYGYLGDLALPATTVRLPKPAPPDLQQPRIPDVVRAQYSAGDKQVVGDLLRAANGEENGLVGITPTFAARILTSFGYPTTMDAWTADQWSSAIESRALEMNPLDILESLGQPRQGY